MSKKLSSRQGLALEALLAGESQQAAAAAANVTGRTITRWLKEPAFAAELAQQNEDAVQNAARRLTGTLDMAIDVLREIMSDSTQPAAVRIRAAHYSAQHMLKLLELSDIQRRLSELEERLRE